MKKHNIEAGADIHAGCGGYSIGTREKYEEFVKMRNENTMKYHVTNTNNPIDFPKTDNKVMFEFLDAVRESGGVNMYEGGHLIQEHFGVDKHKAREIVLEWMQTFNQRHPVAK